MKTGRLLGVGIVGTIVTALCCFTPVLVILLGAVGLSALLGWLDYVLLPALGLFLLITAYALWRWYRERPCPDPICTQED
ncbi:MAG: mercury resistance system transport protein MerF [Rhodothalassiaceae bacterium]